MEVYASFRQKVQVNPQDVVQGLIDQAIGWRGWVVERDGKYYQGHEVSAGSHSFDNEAEIKKDFYDYIKALELVLKKLEEAE